MTLRQPTKFSLEEQDYLVALHAGKKDLHSKTNARFCKSFICVTVGAHGKLSPSPRKTLPIPTKDVTAIDIKWIVLKETLNAL